MLLQIVQELGRVINHGLLWLVQAILHLLPSTPAAAKPAVVLDALHSAFPLMPWGAVAQSISVIAAVLAAKVLVRVILDLIP